MELIVAAVGTVGLWLYYKSRKAQTDKTTPPPTEPPPPTPPPAKPEPVLSSAILKALTWTTVPLFGRHATGPLGGKKLKLKLNQTQTVLMDTQICGFRGQVRVDSNGQYSLVGQNNRMYKLANVTWTGTAKPGDKIMLARNEWGASYEGVGVKEEGELWLEVA